MTEHEQSGYVVYRVRVGPFDKTEAADKAKDKLASSGFEAVMVSVKK